MSNKKRGRKPYTELMSELERTQKKLKEVTGQDPLLSDKEGYMAPVRDVLRDQIKHLTSAEPTTKTTISVTNTVRQLIASYKIELDYAKKGVDIAQIR